MPPFRNKFSIRDQNNPMAERAFGDSRPAAATDSCPVRFLDGRDGQPGGRRAPRAEGALPAEGALKLVP
jgi:hypothetical protein